MSLPIQYLSSINGIQWPPIPNPMGAQLIALLNYLDKSQWLSFEQIKANQAQQLLEIVNHAKQTTDYYKDSLGFLKPNLDSISLLDSWLEIPLLTRKNLQRAGNTLYSQNFPRDHGSSYPLSTSGSTGRPVTILTTDATQFFWNVFTLRDHLWHKRDFKGALAVIKFSLPQDAKPPHGMSYSDWGAPANLITQTGPSMGLYPCAVDEEMAWLQRVNPDYLICFPSKLKEFIRYMQEHNIKLPKLREVRTISEIVESDLRNLMHNELNIALTDTYTAAEVGYIALQCPECEHYHIQSENVFVEILTEENTPCQPGEIGKVVITSLHNFASPLIRYEIGDYAKVGEPCRCGRGLTVFTSILGRQRNMLTLPNGKKVWPRFGFGDKSLMTLFPINQYQLIQRSLEELELKLTCVPLSIDGENTTKKWLHEILDYPFQIKFTYVDEIPRSASGKFEDFKSELEVN